ncbi:Cdc25 phosphatase Ibp1 [Ciborinia camelliae]|nr:Cdc25 phosphatase Ibp1 [Ciborinia camelliae]
MSTITIGTLPRLSSKALSDILLSHTSSNLDSPSAPQNLAIIDVRDDDHIGGHIKHSTHIPSSTLDYKIPELVRKLREKEIVVFHCALSQQRGPSAALRYIRERERIIGGGVGGVGKAMKKNKEEEEGEKHADDAEWEDIVEGPEKKEQMVYVLDRGFVGWQEIYGEDTRLTEGYRKEIWQDGY